MIQKEYIKPELAIVILRPHQMLITSVTVTGLDEDFEGYGGEGNDDDEAD